VEDKSLRRRSVGIDVVVPGIELLLSDPRKLDTDTNGHAAFFH
jgi:hypothetical protein